MLKVKESLSLQNKMIGIIFLSCLAVLIIIRVYSPYMLEKQFIEEAKQTHYEIFKSNISQLIMEYSDWGTPEMALIYSKRFFSELRPPSNILPRPLLRSATARTKVLEGRDIRNPELDRYKFGLIDNVGHILIPINNYSQGEQVSRDIIDRGEALYIDGVIVAYAIQVGKPPISENNSLFLTGIKKSLNFGILLSMAVALVLGYFMARGLTKDLRQLLTGVESINRGIEGQQIDKISTKGELGVLIKSFNRMSQSLKDSHDKLALSRETIEEQIIQLNELSIRDELTGLYNRRFFNEQIKIILANTKRYEVDLSLIMADLDFFKLINDDYSHPIGDQVLKNVAQIISQNLRESDLLARYGGEEFIIALPRTESKSALIVLERIRKDIEGYQWSSIVEGLKLTMSFGAFSGRGNLDFETMLNKSDELLYKAKSEGRNRVVQN